MLVLLVNDRARSGGANACAAVRGANDWEVLRADSVDRAIQTVNDQNVDVVITENHVGATEGSALLREVRRLRPDAVRILLSNADTPDGTLRAASVAHRCLPVPVGPDELVDAVLRVARLRAILQSDSLRQLVGSIDKLPSPPRVYMRLMETLHDPDAGAGEVADVVCEDPALAAKVLRLCNSAFYSMLRPVSDIRMAVVRLGLRTIRHLVLACEVFGGSGKGGHDPERVQRGALIASVMAPAVLGRWADAELARTAALLANVGKLLDAVPDDSPVHAEAGAYLLGLWGLPETIVEAVAMHHDPRRAEGKQFGLVGAVHVATTMTGDGELDEAYLEKCGKLDMLPHWRQQLEELNSLL